MSKNELKREGFFARVGPREKPKGRMSLAIGTDLRSRLRAVVEDMVVHGIETEQGRPANEHWLICQLVQNFVERYENGYRPEIEVVKEEKQVVRW